MNYTSTQNHILYQALSENDEIVYIGSSGLPISRLEFNHRNFRSKGYSETRFRKALEEKGNEWKFETLHESNCSRERIEYLEGIAIREAMPKYNNDLFPLESSKQYGRLK